MISEAQAYVWASLIFYFLVLFNFTFSDTITSLS